MQYEAGESFPLLTPLPQTYDQLTDWEKVDRCYRDNHFCPGIYPFVFMKEMRSPRTSQVLR